MPCQPRSADDAECRAQFIRAFGLKAFRRPLTSVEVGRYSALFAGEARRTGKFLDGAQLVVEAMLQSPDFLFRAERGRFNPALRNRQPAFVFPVGHHARCRAFRRAPRAVSWRTPGSVEKQARRMLRRSAARQSVDEFTSEWLRFDRLLSAVKDRRRYPQYSPELAAVHDRRDAPDDPATQCGTIAIS